MQFKQNFKRNFNAFDRNADCCRRGSMERDLISECVRSPACVYKLYRARRLSGRPLPAVLQALADNRILRYRGHRATQRRIEVISITRCRASHHRVSSRRCLVPIGRSLPSTRPFSRGSANTLPGIYAVNAFSLAEPPSRGIAWVWPTNSHHLRNAFQGTSSTFQHPN